MLSVTINALSQTLNNQNGNGIYDTSFPNGLEEKNFQANNSSVQNAPQLKMVGLMPDFQFDEFPINHNMHIATDGIVYYTINGGNSGTGQINVFDLTGVLIQTYPIQIDGRGLSYNKADGFLYASLYARDIVRIDNLASGTFTTIFAAGMQNDQASFAISNDGTKYFDFYTGTLLIHDFFTGAVINTISGLNFGPGNFGGEEAVAVDSLYIFTWDATIKTVSKYDMSGNLMQTLLLDSGENGHSISRAGNYLFVAHDGNYATGTWYGYLVDSVMNVSAINTCFGDTTFFNLTGTTNLLGAQWDFGDPASGVNNVSYNPNTFHTFTQLGTYAVQVIRFFTSYTDTVMLNITINSVPVINFGIDTVFCAGDSVQLNAGGGFTSYAWQDASTDSSFTATVAGTYYVTVSNSGCIGTDTINLGVNICSALVANFYSTDTSFCEKLCIDFTDLSTNIPTSWQWFFPGSDSLTSMEQNPTGICYNNYGSYDVTLIACNAAGCDTLFLPGFINEYATPVPTITQSNDTLFSSPGVGYQWWSVDSGLIAGATNNYFVPTFGSDYFVIVTDTIGCAGTSNVISITGIKQLSIVNYQLSIIPNPNNGSFAVSFSAFNFKDFQLRIIDPIGRIVFQNNAAKHLSNCEIRIELGAVAKGLYTIVINNDSEIYRSRFVVK